MREERIAVFPGSFDPVTLGHMDIIERAAQLFDRVYVAIVPNGEKTHPMFTDEEKLELMRVSVAPLGNVEAALWNGLLTDFAAQKGARFLVRGARNSMDFDAEPAHQHISSTMAREMVKYHQPLEKYLPAAAAARIRGKDRG